MPYTYDLRQKLFFSVMSSIHGQPTLCHTCNWLRFDQAKAGLNEDRSQEKESPNRGSNPESPAP